MSLDRLLKPVDCQHLHLRVDRPQPTGRFDEDKKEIMLAQYTCIHPTEPYCHSTFYGEDKVRPYVYKYQIGESVYHSKVKQK